jgi:hypothetical protein
MPKVTAQESEKKFIDHASFEETHHRTHDGLIASNKETWRTRNNNKPMKVTRT